MAAQISASANQQASGVLQLNQGIRNIDNVTRENLLAIQQIEQSVQNVDALSRELASLVERSQTQLA
jgi:methyl-accepting chemotaxis protein